jgi:hypothetical protein
VKRCCLCTQVLPAISFYQKKSGQLSARCRTCHGLGNRTCIVCGTSFVGSTNAKLCSDQCRTVHRPQTFLECRHCGRTFGPVDHLSRVYCSRLCKHAAMATGRRVMHCGTVLARRAQRRIAYLLAVGKMQRLSNCAECGATAYTEAAHFDYERPEEVRWLCRSCHRRWDQADPKGGTERLAA